MAVVGTGAMWRGARCALLAALAVVGCSDAGTRASSTPVACADLRTLRDLAPQLAVVTNPSTGNALEYVIVGDGADSDEVVVFFPGTGGILADWPTQMISNVAASPMIAGTDAYTPLEDAPVSLCHRYRLLLFDYAGVGEGRAAIVQTFDSIASDVDALLNDASTRFGIPTSDVSVLGWSLGTHAAMKFSLLSSASVPQRRIHDVVLIATDPGGATDGLATGNQAPCVTTLLDVLGEQIDSDLRTRLDTDAFRLTFPYVGQPPYDQPVNACQADVDVATGAVDYSVTLAPCLADNECSRSYGDQLDNRETAPWAATQGVPYDVYVNERGYDHDWDFCWCAAAGNDFTSRDCACSEPVDISSTNGGVCQCHIPPGQPDAPECAHCVDLGNDGRLTVLNGPEDMFAQWTYGRELVRAYQAQYGADRAQIFTYADPDGAGHGVLLQHPRWTQERIYAALAR